VASRKMPRRKARAAKKHRDRVARAIVRKERSRQRELEDAVQMFNERWAVRF